MIKIEIVTAEKLVLSKDCYMAVIPATEGEMGVLKNHTPLITTLGAGKITLYKSADEVDSIIEISGGFVEVTSCVCRILADAVIENK